MSKFRSRRVGLMTKFRSPPASSDGTWNTPLSYIIDVIMNLPLSQLITDGDFPFILYEHYMCGLLI